jgi:phage terminase Nu1 subunit (DNA packaging protein)
LEDVQGVKGIADLLSLTTARVHQLVKAGVIEKADRGQYDVVQAVTGYIVFLREKLAGKDSDSIDNKKEKARLIKYQAYILQHDLLTKQAQLVPLETVQKVMNDMVAICSMGMDSLLGRLAGQLPGMTNPSKIQKVLLDEIRVIRRTNADAIRKYAVRLLK